MLPDAIGPFCTSPRRLGPSWIKVAVARASQAPMAKGAEPRDLYPGPEM